MPDRLMVEKADRLPPETKQWIIKQIGSLKKDGNFRKIMQATETNQLFRLFNKHISPTPRCSTCSDAVRTMLNFWDQCVQRWKKEK